MDYITKHETLKADLFALARQRERIIETAPPEQADTVRAVLDNTIEELRTELNNAPAPGLRNVGMYPRNKKQDPVRGLREVQKNGIITYYVPVAHDRGGYTELGFTALTSTQAHRRYEIIESSY